MLLVVLQSHTNLLSFFNLGGQEETRTLSLRLLRPLRLPISPHAHILVQKIFALVDARTFRSPSKLPSYALRTRRA